MQTMLHNFLATHILAKYVVTLNDGTQCRLIFAAAAMQLYATITVATH